MADEPDNRSTSLDALIAALGGRPICAWVWLMWLCLAVVITTGADVIGEPANFGTYRAFFIGVAGVLVVVVRLAFYLRNREQRRLLVSVDPRSSSQKISDPTRAGVIIIPILALGAVAAVLLWKIWGL